MKVPRQWEDTTPRFRKVPCWVSKKREKPMPLSKDQMGKIFVEHDKDGDGHLNKKELKEAFRRIGSRLPGYRAGRAIHYADIDGDGAINNEHEIDHLVSYAIKFGYTLY